MSRWIDAEWLLNFFEPYPNDYQTPLGLLRACVDDAPSIDIVRCKECKHNVGLSNGDGFWEEDIVCDYWDSDGLTAEDYCSYGERKESEYDAERIHRLLQVPMVAQTV